MNYRSPLLIIKASAGTGKTYRLVREYIRSILYQNLDSIDFKKILALTFTRSATGEIRDRILELLARASEDKELCKQISTELDFPFKTTEAKKILRQMLANIDSVNIQTIDSFLNKCATLVASEIGLPVNWSILLGEDNEDLFSEESFEIFLENLGNESEVAQIFREFEENRSVVNLGNLIEPIKNAYEIQHVSSEKSWSFLDLSFRKSKSDFSVVREASEKHNFYISKILKEEGYFKNKNWKKLLSQGIARGVFNNIAGGIPKYGSSQIPRDVFEAYVPVVKHACLKIIEGANLRTKQYQRFAMEYFKARRMLQNQNGFFSFNEICWRLKTASNLNIIHNFYISTDSKIDHLLIDEFQDTSQAQFSVLFPIIDQLVSDQSTPSSFLAVGDTKQSVYGWRGGEPALLESLTSIFGEQNVSPQTLSVNYRSSDLIIKSINKFFSNLDLVAQSVFDFEKDTHLIKVFEDWSKSYDPLVANNKDDFGEFRVLSSDSRDAESIVSETVNRVEGYVRRGGGGSVAVLLRANKYVGEISAGLGGLDNPLTVEGGEGKTHLSDSSAVLLLISLIRAIEFPGDSSARVHIENSPLQLFFKEKGVECWLGEKKQEISTNGFIKTVIKIFKPIESFMNSHDINQIEKAFRHIAVVYKNTTRLSRVIDFLTKHREANSRGADVSIMTIHQSKGLDFDYVVLPIFPKEYFYRPKSIAVSKGKDGFVNSMASWPNKEFDSLWGDHAGIRKNDEARQCRESICLQYVAMTRARLGVSVILPKESNNITKTVDQMVRCAFSSVESVNKDKNLIYLVERRGATPKHKDREEVDLAKGLADRFLDSI